jgi:hypothetical protein
MRGGERRCDLRRLSKYRVSRRWRASGDDAMVGEEDNVVRAEPCAGRQRHGDSLRPKG